MGPQSEPLRRRKHEAMNDKAQAMKKNHGGAYFFDYFDAKYLISLPERKERLQYVQKQFEKHRLPFTEIILFKGVKCREKEGFRDLGVRGCFLSHLEVLKNAKAWGGGPRESWSWKTTWGYAAIFLSRASRPRTEA